MQAHLLATHAPSRALETMSSQPSQRRSLCAPLSLGGFTGRMLSVVVSRVFLALCSQQLSQLAVWFGTKMPKCGTTLCKNLVRYRLSVVRRNRLVFCPSVPAAQKRSTPLTLGIWRGFSLTGPQLCRSYISTYRLYHLVFLRSSTAVVLPRPKQLVLGARHHAGECVAIIFRLPRKKTRVESMSRVRDRASHEVSSASALLLLYSPADSTKK